MDSRLRRWIALLALLFVPVSGSAASPLCMPVGAEAGAGGATAHAGHGGHGGHHDHRGDAEHRGEDGRRHDDRPASPGCPLMVAGAGGCPGGFLSSPVVRVAAEIGDRHSFVAPVEPRPRIAAVSLFRPPRA